MNKEQLEDKVNELELTLNSLELNAKVVKDDLKKVETQLKNVNKPRLYPSQLDDIRNAIEEVFNQSSFNDVESYDVDFEIDYNNSVGFR